MSKIKNAIDRMRGGEDLGLDRSAEKGRQRAINKDGTYNVERKTGRLFGNFYLYHWLITTAWKNYWIALLCFYVFMNIVFATIYFFVGVEQLNGIHEGSWFTQWLYCFFFSAQSYTTVGYGGIHPVGETANFVAVTEAFFGLMTFAIATGTLYGRFSKPVSRIKYSPNILVAPFKEGHGLMFMVANELDSSLVEMEARVTISWSDLDAAGKPIRRFQQVKLEIDKISMFPTNWVINHPIDEESALFQKSMEDVKALDMEVFILLKGFDDVFSQTIYSRNSYVANQFVWNAKFKRPFYSDNRGKVVLDLRKVGEYDLL